MLWSFRRASNLKSCPTKLNYLNDRPVNLMQPLKTVIISILWTILFGEQKGLDDPALGELINIIDEGLRVISPTSILGLILPDPIMTT
jgi:hypothetical protein